MKRRVLCGAASLGLAGIVGPNTLRAQQRRTVPRVAYIYMYREGPSAPQTSAFLARMRELGWINGESVRIDIYDANSDPARLDAITREVIAANVDVIVAACTPEAKSATKFTTTIPIVMAATGDPVLAGLAASFARPGGNVTGVSAMVLEQSAKRLEILKGVFPKLEQAAVLWNPARPDNKAEVAAMQAGARALGVRLDSQEVRSREELIDALNLMPKSTQAILNAGDTLVNGEAVRITRFASANRLPTMFEDRTFVDVGGLMSYGPNFPGLHRRAADYVDRILKGARPADMPIEQPSRFELVLNLKTAQVIGVDIPGSTLALADHVIR